VTSEGLEDWGIMKMQMQEQEQEQVQMQLKESEWQAKDWRMIQLRSQSSKKRIG
jgi:hypothetical protein